MRVSTKPTIGYDNGIAVTFRFPMSAREDLKPMFDTIEQFSPDSDYELTFGKAKKPRSNNANSYMWVLCDKIAKVIRSTKEEVYRSGLKAVGKFSDVAVQEGEPCAELVKAWGSNGIGYFSERFNSTLRDKDGNRMVRVRLYEGSHKYNTADMSRLVDWVVDEAKTLNIETMTEDKIKELKASWGD